MGNISRRSFLKGSAIAATGMGLAGVSATAAFASEGSTAGSGSISASSSKSASASASGSSAASVSASATASTSGSVNAPVSGLSVSTAPAVPVTLGSIDADTQRYIPDFMKAPEPYTEWDEEVDCDVAVVGLGVAGICATRSAMEEGVKVVAIEKCADFSFRSAQFAAINSSVHKASGCEFDDAAKQKIVQAFMVDSCWRANQRIWERWANESGEIFDWYVSAFPDYKILDSRLIVKDSIDTAKELGLEDYLDPDNKPSGLGGSVTDALTVTVLDWPNNDSIDNFSNTYPQYFCPAYLIQGQMGLHTKHKEMFESADNVDLRFNTKGMQLIKEDGRITGVFAQDADGKIIKINAANGVVMTTGDYMGNTEMRDYYLKTSFLFPNYVWTSFDSDGNSTSDGSAIKMGLWAGAKVEQGEHAEMVHGFGGGLGFDPFLFVDGNGERFMNENTRGDLFSIVSARATGGCFWQIFDDNYPDQVGTMPSGHACCFKIVDDETDEAWGNYLGATNVRTRAAVEDACTCICDTIEELASQMGVDAATLQATIDRYNELAANGFDADYGKRADLLYPIEKAPFYASKVTADDQMRFCALTGLWSDEESRVYDTEGQILPGLYAAGNAQGNRFSVDYPTTYMGTSHGMAMTYGYIAGKNAAAKLS